MLTAYTNFSARIFFYFVLFLCSCALKQVDIAEKWNDKWIAKTIQIPIDKRTDFTSSYTTVYKSGEKEYIVRLNRFTNSLQFYNSGKLSFEVKFDYAGPDGVGRIQAAYVVSMDTIILLSSFSNRIYLGNREGKVIKSYQFSPDKMVDGTFGFLVAFTFSPIVKFGNKLYLHTSQFYSFCDPRYYSNASSGVAELDLLTGAIRNCVTFPEEYQNKSWTFSHAIIFLAANTEKKDIYLSFPASPYLYIFRPETNTLIKKDMSTKRIKAVPNLSYFECISYDDSRLAQESFRFSFYGPVVYSEAEKRFYRFYHLPDEKENYKRIKSEDFDFYNGICAHPTGVIVADEELNVLADVVLPEHTFHPYDYFVTKEGVWLSQHNYFNRSHKEDEMTFSLLKF